MPSINKNGNRSSSSLLFKCLGVAIVLHSVGLFFFYQHPLWLSKAWTSFFSKFSTTSTESLAQTLQNPFFPAGDPLFEDLTVVPGTRLPHDIGKEMHIDTLRKIEQNSACHFHAHEELFIPPQPNIVTSYDVHQFQSQAEAPPLATTSKNLGEIPQAPLDRLQSSSALFLLEQIAKVPRDQNVELSVLSSPIEPQAQICEPSPLTTTLPLTVDRFPSLSRLLIQDSAHSVSVQQSFEPSLILRASPRETGRQSIGTTSMPSAASYGLPSTQNWTDIAQLFSFDLRTFPMQENGEILFSITLMPKKKAELKNMKQHFYFLIDCSKSIPRHRINVFKQAVKRSLTSLEEGHDFNIILLDHTIQRLDKTPLPVSRKALRKAESFLEQVEPKGTAITQELAASLDELAKNSSKEGLHTIILLSDGGHLFGKNNRRSPLQTWLHHHRHQFVIYTVTASDENDLSLLELFSTSSGGRLLHSPTHAALPRKLAKLLLDIQYPVAHGLSAEALPFNRDSSLQLSSTSSLPPLFANVPYVLIGSTKETEHFTLTLQGRSNNEYFEISKMLSLQEARPGSRLIAQKWQELQAQKEYASFLHNGKVSSLSQAVELLKKASSTPEKEL